MCASHRDRRTYVRARIKRPRRAILHLSLSHPSFPTPPPVLFFSLSPSFSPLSVYARTQIPRVDVGTVISPESKAPASGVGTSVREFLNPFLHDSCSAWPGLRLCPGLACCWLRVVGTVEVRQLDYTGCSATYTTSFTRESFVRFFLKKKRTHSVILEQ